MLDLITQRSIVIGLAIVGALVVTVVNWLVRSGKLEANQARVYTRTGYLITGLSVVLFIIAGFRAD